MKITLGELKRMIREAYDKDLVDDPSFQASSVLVPADVKSSIEDWIESMGLSRKKKRDRQS